MPQPTTAAGVDLRGYPVVTRAEAHALVRASKALAAIADRARRDAYSDDASAARRGSILMERAASARDELSSFLIAAAVHADSARADRALERS